MPEQHSNFAVGSWQQRGRKAEHAMSVRNIIFEGRGLWILCAAQVRERERESRKELLCKKCWLGGAKATSTSKFANCNLCNINAQLRLRQAYTSHYSTILRGGT